MVAGTRTSTSTGTSRINISHRQSSSSATSTKRRCHVTFQHFCMQMQIYSSMTTCHTGCTCCSLYAKKWHACSSNIYSWLPSWASSDKHERTQHMIRQFVRPSACPSVYAFSWTQSVRVQKKHASVRMNLMPHHEKV